LAEHDAVSIEFLRRRLHDLDAQARQTSVGDAALMSGGGGGTSGGMEARIAKLESDMREVKDDTRAIRDTLIRIEGKLDLKAGAEAVAEIKGKLDTKASAEAAAEIKGKLDAKASATDLGVLSGKLNDKPDTWKVVVIVLALGAIMGGSQLVKALSDAFRPSQAATNSSPVMK
jgi:hypothetical protein